MRFSAGHNNLNVKKFVGEIACFARAGLPSQHFRFSLTVA